MNRAMVRTEEGHHCPPDLAVETEPLPSVRALAAVQAAGLVLSPDDCRNTAVGLPPCVSGRCRSNGCQSRTSSCCPYPCTDGQRVQTRWSRCHPSARVEHWAHLVQHLVARKLQKGACFHTGCAVPYKGRTLCSRYKSHAFFTVLGSDLPMQPSVTYSPQ